MRDCHRQRSATQALSLLPLCRYEELSELSQKYKIRSCPMFIFWKGGKAVEEFATRDRVRVAKAINKHAGFEVLEPK